MPENDPRDAATDADGVGEASGSDRAAAGEALRHAVHRVERSVSLLDELVTEVTPILECLGHACRVLGDPVTARRLFDQAAGLLRQGSFASRSRLLAGPSHPETSSEGLRWSGWPQLSRTEGEVASLAAHGFGNAEIAEKLFISTNTVKTHLTHVYAKLGISSRRDLRRLAAERPLV